MKIMKNRSKVMDILWDVHDYGINVNTREVYIHPNFNDLEEEQGINVKVACNFIKNLHILEHLSKDHILIHMQSVGGSWEDGMAMFNAIQFAKSPITIVAYAQASSMTGILFQSAPTRLMMPDCHLMIHHGSVAINTNSEAAKEIIVFNEKASERMVEIFAKRAVKGMFFRKKKMKYQDVFNYIDEIVKKKNDWYIDAQEAVDYGFADGIMGTKGFESFDLVRG